MGNNTRRPALGKGLALIVVILAFMTTIQPGWAAERVPADAVKAGTVAAKGISYYGQNMKIYGYVSMIHSPRLFIVTDGLQGTTELPIIVRGGDVQLAVGDTVIVEGAPMAYDAGRLSQDYGITLPDAATFGWENKPVVIADKVRKVKR